MALIDIVKKGSTDRSVTLRIIDSGDGTPETGVVFNSSGIDLWYRREGAAKVSITEADLATPALDDPHLDGGFLHIGDGEYRLDAPDAAFAIGANYVDFGGTVTDMVVIGGRVRLVGVDLEDTVRAGLTALPNAAADAAGGLPTSDAGGLDLDALSTFDPAADAVANVTLVGTVTTLTGHTAQTGDSFARLGAPAGASVSADVAAVKAETALIATLEDLDATEVQAAVNAALVALHLDHLLAVTYDPATKPGAADALFNELIGDDAGVSQFTENALALGPSAGGGDATEAKQDTIIASLAAAKGTGFDTATDSLEAIRDRGDVAWLSGAGEGSIEFEYTLTSSVDSAPIDDALVEVYTDEAMTNKTAQARTDAFGVAVFHLDAGTYYFKRTKGGFSFDNPDEEVVE